MKSGPEDFYVILARRLYVSPAYAKLAFYLCGYGGGDPWLRHLVLGEANAMMTELKRPSAFDLRMQEMELL